MPLAESPFSCRLLDVLFYLSCVLVFPSYWFIDRLLSCVVATSVERSRGTALRILCLVTGVPLFALLFALFVPLCVFGLLLWVPLHQIRRPFSYQRSVGSRDRPERIIAGDCSFTFISANLCFLPDGLARFSNLCHTQRRATTISRLLCDPPERGPENGLVCVPQNGSDCGFEDVLPMVKRPSTELLCDSPEQGPENGSACGLQDVLPMVERPSTEFLSNPPERGPENSSVCGLEDVLPMVKRPSTELLCDSPERGPENGSACGLEDVLPMVERPSTELLCDFPERGPENGSACGLEDVLPMVERPSTELLSDPPERGPANGLVCGLQDVLPMVERPSTELLSDPPERGPANGSVCGLQDVLPMVETPSTKLLEGPDCSFEVSEVFPQNSDFLCLQEVFDGRASRKLRRCLSSSYPYILYDVGPSGPHGCGFKFFNSGLFLASRHPIVNAKYYIYPNGRGEDALASKGLLCVKVYLGTTQQRQSIVGFLNCTHLHAPESDAAIRWDQLSLLLQWISDFQAENTQDGELLAFDVLCGDLNFDNCSSGNCLEQKHMLFSMYRDPCRDCAGRDCPGSMGTLLRQELLYHEAVNTPSRLKRTLLSDGERRVYVASPSPQDDDGSDEHWTGRRIDYILYREGDTLLPVVVDNFQFITRLAGLSDHIPVSLRLSSTLPEITAL